MQLHKGALSDLRRDGYVVRGLEDGDPRYFYAQHGRQMVFYRTREAARAIAKRWRVMGYRKVSVLRARIELGLDVKWRAV